jgi:hypothetical protein
MGLRSGDSGNLKAPGGFSKLGKLAYEASPGSRMLLPRLESVSSVAAKLRCDGVMFGGVAVLKYMLSAGARVRFDVGDKRRARRVFSPVSRVAEKRPNRVSVLVPVKATSRVSPFTSVFFGGHISDATLCVPSFLDVSNDKSTFALRAGSERLSAMDDAVARAVGQASPSTTWRGLRYLTPMNG